MEGSDSNYNDQQNIETRPCQNCGGSLQFDIGQQRLACPSCGHAQDIVHAPDAEVREQSYAALGHGRYRG